MRNNNNLVLRAYNANISIIPSRFGMEYLQNERIDDFIKTNNVTGSNLRTMMDVFSTSLSKANRIFALTIGFTLEKSIDINNFLDIFTSHYYKVFNDVFSIAHKDFASHVCELTGRVNDGSYLPYNYSEGDFVIVENNRDDKKTLSGFLLMPIPASMNNGLIGHVKNMFKEAWEFTVKKLNIAAGPSYPIKTHYNVVSGADGATKRNELGYTTGHLRNLYQWSKKESETDILFYTSKNKIAYTDIQFQPLDKAYGKPNIKSIDLFNLKSLEGWRKPKTLTSVSKAFKDTKTSKGVIKRGERFMIYKKPPQLSVYPTELTALRKNISNHIHSILTEYPSTGILPFSCRLDKNTTKEELKAIMKSFFRNINRGIKKNLRGSGKKEFNVKYVWRARLENYSGTLRVDLFITYPRSVYLTPRTKSSRHKNNNSLADIVTLAWAKEHPNRSIIFMSTDSDIYDTEQQIFPKSQDEVNMGPWYYSLFVDRPKKIERVVRFVTDLFDFGFFNDPLSSYGLSRNK